MHKKVDGRFVQRGPRKGAGGCASVAVMPSSRRGAHGRPYPGRTAVLGRSKLRWAMLIAVVAAFVPLRAHGAGDNSATQAAGIAADTVWVVVAACFVLFMQAGFAMLEVGFARMKNVGTVVAKILTNLSVSSIAYWAVGFGLAFGAGS